MRPNSASDRFAVVTNVTSLRRGCSSFWGRRTHHRIRRRIAIDRSSDEGSRAYYMTKRHLRVDSLSLSVGRGWQKTSALEPCKHQLVHLLLDGSCSDFLQLSFRPENRHNFVNTLQRF